MPHASRPPSESQLSRRDFVTRTLATAAVIGAAPMTSLAHAARIQGANDRVGVGVIGAGIRGEILIRATHGLPGTRILEVCDIYDGHFARVREILGPDVRTTRDYRRMLEHPDIQAVVIAVPDHWHLTMALDAMAAGKDVYIEKPMTHRWEDGAAIIEAARTRQRIVQVGSQYQSMAANPRAIEIIRSGVLGQITLINGAIHRNTATGAWYYPVPPDASPETIDWTRFIGPAPWHEFDAERFFRWRLYWDYSGGLPTDLFVHLVTATHSLMGVTMPDRVVAMGGRFRWKEREVPDQMSAMAEYPEGFMLNMTSTSNNGHRFPTLLIMGTEGTLEYNPTRLVLHREPMLESYGYSTNHFPAEQKTAFAVQQDLDPASMRPRATAGVKAPPPEVIDFPEAGDSTPDHLAKFYDSVRTRKEPVENAVMGHQCATVGHMVNISHRQQVQARWDAQAQRVVT